MAVYQIPDPHCAAAPAVGGAGVKDPGALIAAAIVAGMQGASQLEPDKKEKYAHYEKMAILAACGLHPGDWDRAPPIYDKITQDGRSVTVVRAALKQQYRDTVMEPNSPHRSSSPPS
jgi:hypothetical protein